MIVYIYLTIRLSFPTRYVTLSDTSHVLEKTELKTESTSFSYHLGNWEIQKRRIWIEDNSKIKK